MKSNGILDIGCEWLCGDHDVLAYGSRQSNRNIEGYRMADDWSRRADRLLTEGLQSIPGGFPLASIQECADPGMGN
jgi:hypothetical protein